MRPYIMKCIMALVCLYMLFAETVFSAEKSTVIVVSGENEIIPHRWIQTKNRFWLIEV